MGTAKQPVALSGNILYKKIPVGHETNGQFIRQLLSEYFIFASVNDILNLTH